MARAFYYSQETGMMKFHALLFTTIEEVANKEKNVFENGTREDWRGINVFFIISPSWLKYLLNSITNLVNFNYAKRK